MCLWNTDASGGNKVKIWQKSLSPTFWLYQTNGRTDRQTDRQMDNPNTRCPRRTFQAGGIKIKHKSSAKQDTPQFGPQLTRPDNFLTFRFYRQNAKWPLPLTPWKKSIGFLLSLWRTCMWNLKVIMQQDVFVKHKCTVAKISPNVAKITMSNIWAHKKLKFVSCKHGFTDRVPKLTFTFDQITQIKFLLIMHNLMV